MVQSRTNKNSECVAIIKQCVTIQNAVERYLTAKPRQNRIPCPFHGGKDYNMGFNGWGYHCFVCGASGDVISFASKLYGLPFRDTLSKLNSDFALGLPIDYNPSEFERNELKKKYEARMAEIEREKKQIEKWESEYQRLSDELISCDLNQMKYAPKSPTEPPNPIWVDAVAKINKIKYLINTMPPNPALEKR